MMNGRMIDLALRDLISSGGVVAAALISTDGLAIASVLQEGIEEDRVGGMSAALLALGNRATKELRCGRMMQVIVQGDDGLILLVEVNEEIVLVLTAEQDAKLGLILLNARKTVKAILEDLG